MDLVPLFQASLYIAVATAAITLAVAEEQGFPSLITLPVAALSFWLVERKKLWSLDDWSAAGLAVLALGFLVWEFQGEETLSRVLAGAHFLVFLTWIVLLQRKQIRQYWFLMALGWLQVAVAAVMTESPGFGVALFFYLLLAVWTLSLFALYQGVADLVGEGQLVSGATENAWGGAWKSARPDPQLTSPAVAQGQAPPRMVDAVTRPTRIRNAIQHDDRERWITPRYASGIFGIAFLGFAVGLCFFLFTPRFWMTGDFSVLGPRHDTSGLSRGLATPVTGFSGQVALGDMGTILENSQPVIQFKLFDRTNDDQPITLEQFLNHYGLEEPVFRGSVLDTYSDKHWTVRDEDRRVFPLGRSQSIARFRQEILLQPTGAPFAFLMSPFVSARPAEGSDSFSVAMSNSVAYLPQRRGRGGYSYYIYSPETAVDRSQQHPNRGGMEPFDRASPELQKLYLALPDNLDRLIELARSTVSNAAKPANQPEDQVAVDAILALLRDSGQFSYSLDADIQDARIDPVEDFLFNRKTGHCEYFATTLALMLRAVGVPTRMVTGFRGAVDTGDGGYEVQQRHAHAWVEGWVDGSWRTLDATPAARDDEIRTYGKSIHWTGDAGAYFSALWNSYVVGLDQERQDTLLLQPLRSAFELGDRSRNSRGLLALVSEIFYELGRDPAAIFRGTGGLIVLALLAVASFALLWSGKLLARLRLLTSRRGADARRFRRPVPFFDSFLALCSRQGWRPNPSQTAREFCDEVASRMRSIRPLAGQPLPAWQSAGIDGPGLALEIGRLFETVRYAEVDLPPDQARDLQSRLAAWQAAAKA
jgi:transglutaminase-like putative cysteine protease